MATSAMRAMTERDPVVHRGEVDLHGLRGQVARHVELLGDAHDVVLDVAEVEDRPLADHGLPGAGERGEHLALRRQPAAQVGEPVAERGDAGHHLASRAGSSSTSSFSTSTSSESSSARWKWASVMAS